jgi:class 3 adenylate cyclase
VSHKVFQGAPAHSPLCRCCSSSSLGNSRGGSGGGARSAISCLVPVDMQARYNGLELSRMIMAGDLPPLPAMHTLGTRWVSVDEGVVHAVTPASEWFCSARRTLDAAAIESFLNIASTSAVMTLCGPGELVAGLELTTRFLRPVPADGRELSCSGRVVHRSGNLITADAEAIDASGQPFAVQSVTYAVLDPRIRRPDEPERVLATLLFTDIVGSTVRAESMGDGFLARFDSPALAVRAARAIRDGVKRLDLEVRGGIHTGECEVHGTDLAGIAVHVAARIVARAGPSEILVSQTVRDHAAGSGIRFCAARIAQTQRRRRRVQPLRSGTLRRTATLARVSADPGLPPSLPAP